MKAEIKYLVDIVESERGWGSKVEETKEFDTQELADTYIKDYNKKYNTSTTVPDIYWRAERGGTKVIPL